MFHSHVPGPPFLLVRLRLFFTSLCFRFLVCNMRVVVMEGTSQSLCEDEMSECMQNAFRTVRDKLSVNVSDYYYCHSGVITIADYR